MVPKCIPLESSDYIITTRGFHYATKVYPQIYREYGIALDKSPIKDQLNLAVKDFSPSPVKIRSKIMGVQCNYLKGYNIPNLDLTNYHGPTPDFRTGLLTQIKKSITKIQSKGIAMYDYHSLGKSPRILPVDYGFCINSSKRVVKEMALVHAMSKEEFKDYVLIDVDIKSRYMAVLLGLFPNELKDIRKTVEETGLWEHYRQLFQETGREAIFNKPSVKVCVYASFFGGGDNAFGKSIHENCRDNLGLTPKEYRESEYIIPIKAFVNDIVSFMKRSKVITAVKGAARLFFYKNKDSIVRGPTGQTYVVTKEEALTSYPMYLQSYEFYLLARSTLDALKKVDDGHVVNHFHDGNIILIKRDEVDSYINAVNESLENLKTTFGLAYPINIEYKLYDKPE